MFKYKTAINTRLRLIDIARNTLHIWIIDNYKLWAGIVSLGDYWRCKNSGTIILKQILTNLPQTSPRVAWSPKFGRLRAWHGLVATKPTTAQMSWHCCKFSSYIEGGYPGYAGHLGARHVRDTVFGWRRVRLACWLGLFLQAGQWAKGRKSEGSEEKLDGIRHKMPRHQHQC